MTELTAKVVIFDSKKDLRLPIEPTIFNLYMLGNGGINTMRMSDMVYVRYMYCDFLIKSRFTSSPHDEFMVHPDGSLTKIEVL